MKLKKIKKLQLAVLVLGFAWLLGFSAGSELTAPVRNLVVPKVSARKSDPKTNQPTIMATSHQPTTIEAKDDPAQRCTDPDGCVSTIFDKIINPIINFMTALVGIVIIAMIIVGGIQYSSSGGDSNKVQASKKKISNALVALAAYIFLFAFLQWIVPGGLF